MLLPRMEAVEDRYSEAIQNNGQLEIRLGVFQAALNVAEEEASAIRARLAESDAAVAGKMSSMNVSIAFVLIFFCNRQLKWCNWSLSNWRQTWPRTPSMLGVPLLTLVSKTSWPASRRLPFTAFVIVHRWC